MANSNDIIIDDVTMTFALHHTVVRNLKERFLGLFLTKMRQDIEQFSALKNVSLKIPAGQCMGILGHNGSGKSTLLSVIAGIYSPTSGRVILPPKAKIGTMIQLGVGFCPELSGRENIFLNASLYGFKHKDVEKLYHQIVEFSELEHFIDTPVKHYSSGMYARLGFAVTVFLDVDILLIDEILGVGDVAFQEKCMAKMNEFKQKGKTIIFVSHDTNSVNSFCDTACLMHHGEVLGTGESEFASGMYQELIHGRLSAEECREHFVKSVV